MSEGLETIVYFGKVRGDCFVCWCGRQTAVSGRVSVILYEGENTCLPSVVQPVRDASS